jgi:hypothetical protein
MKRLYCIGLVCNMIFLPSGTTQAQGKLSLNRNAQHLYLCMGGADNQVQEFQRVNNIGSVQLIGGADISSGNKLNLNTVTLANAIKRAFPDSLMQGLGALDWEGDELKILRNETTNAAVYKNTLNTMMSVLDFAQKLRPKVLWGFYGLPYREFWKRNSDWRKSGEKLMPLLDKQDILYPSVYLLYNPQSVAGMGNSNYLEDNIQQALSLGIKLNKPVLPFVWHRYPNYDQIPVAVFKKQVAQILSENTGGQKVVGIVWWNSDNYFYRSGNKVFVKEVGDNQKPVQYYDALALNYCKELLQVIQK